MAVGAVLLLLAVAGGPPAAAARPEHANASTSWEDLFEETGSSVQSHWLLPWSGSPVKTLPGALPEYYGATAHPVLPPDGDESPLTLVLRASAALRDNIATVFGYFLHLPENALDAELYSALRLLHGLVRLRRVRVAALVGAVPEMADAPPRRQWRALLARMRRAAPRWAAGAVAEWADALEARRVDVEGVMRPRGGALKVDFLAGFDRPAVQRLGALQVESYYNAESIASEGDGRSSGGDKFVGRVFDALRDRSLRFSQRLFGLLLSYRPRNVILPDKEESERHLVAILLNSQLDGWDRLSWSFEDEHLQYLHDFIRLVLSTLLQSGDLKPQTRGLVREVLEYVEIPKPTFSNFYFEQLASILTEPSLDILKFIENIVIGEYPNEIINLRRRLESYFRNGFLNVDLALQGFNRFDYSTPNDILVAFLTRLNRQFPNLPHDISSTIGHLKQHINFKSSKQKLLPVLNSDVIDMFHVFESYYVADEIVLASLKLKAQLQVEDNDFSEIIKMVRPDECGQPRSCIHTILKVALNSNVLLGKKSKELIKDFLDLLDENGEPVHFLHVYHDFQKKDNHLNIPRTQPHFPRNRQARIYCSGKGYCTGVLRHNNVRKYKKKIGNNSGNDSIEKSSPFPDSSSVNIADSTAPGRKRLRARKRGSKRIRPNTTRSGPKEKVTSDTVLGSNLTSVVLSSITSNPITSWEFKASEIFTRTPTFPQSSSKSKTIKSLTSTTVSTMSTGTLRTRKRRKPRPTPSRFPITSTTLTVTPHYGYNEKELTTASVASPRRKRDVAWKVNEGSTERPVEDAWPATRESSEITTTENAAELHPNTFITTSPLKKITTKSDSRFSTPDTVKLNSASSDYTETLRNSSYDTQRRAFNTAEKRHRKATKDSIDERREHKHFKNSIRPIISASVEQTDPEYTDESDDVSQKEYHPTKVRSPMQFEGVERKSHRISQRKGTHRRRKGHVIASTKRNTKRKGMKYREHGLAVEGSYEDDLPRYYIEEFDSHSRERSCETDEDGNCVDYSDSREDKSDASEEVEALLSSGGETQDEGSGDAMDTNRDFGAKDSTSTTPRPLHLSTAQTKERFKMITREWSKKSRKQRKQHKHGVRAVGHFPLDVSSHHGDHPTHGDPFEPLELPLLHGRKPIRYKIIIMKRNRKHRSKRLRRRRKKIPKGIFQPRHINHFSDDDGGGDYERNNSTGRQISSVGSSEERNHEDDSHGQTEEDDTEYELCSESGEDYPKCADDGNTSGEESHSHYDEDVVIVKPARARGLQDSHEDSGEKYDDDDLDDSSYEDSAEAVVEYDDNHADHYGSRSREFPEIGLSSRSLGGSLDALDDWKRRLARGWEPPKFTLICPTREPTVCPDPSPPPPVLYTAVSQVEWKANWTYFSDPLEVSRLSQPSLRQLPSGARVLRLRGQPALSAREAALAEALLAALAADYARGASTPQPGAGAAGQRRAARRALARAGARAGAGAALPVPGEAAELLPANARRLDALLPPTAPGSLADVRLRPLRLFLAPLRAPRPAPARKGPLLRWALRELVLAERRAAADPLLALPARQLLRTWGARRGSRPRAEVAAWSLADALPPAGAGAEGAEAVEAARALLTRPEWRAAAEAAALEGEVEEEEGEEGGAATKAQLLRRVLLRASQQGHAHALAPLLAEAAARWVLAEGLGAQAPARTLAAGLRVDLRALLRRHLRAARVLADAGATAALRTLLRAAADGSLAFRRVDAARCRTSAQLLRALLRHLAGDGANPAAAAAAAAQLLPFVLETHLPLPPLAFE